MGERKHGRGGRDEGGRELLLGGKGEGAVLEEEEKEELRNGNKRAPRRSAWVHLFSVVPPESGVPPCPHSYPHLQ